jgi:basic amino acid/polyamine antiporter, APA family
MSDELRRTLDLRDLTLLIIGGVIGSGIFLVPGAVLTQVHGRVLIALLAWIAGGVLSLLGALTYGELTASNPEAGGLYVFIRDGFGVFPAFLFGWTLFFAISAGTNATLAVGFTNNLAEVLPLSSAAAKAIAVLVLTIITVVNVRGTRQGADLQNWTTAIKIAVLILMSAVFLFLGRNLTMRNPEPAATQADIWHGFGLAMIGVLWAYEGWQYSTFCASETLDPQRNFPRGFLIGMSALIGIYLLTNVAYLAALGAKAMAASQSAAAASLLVLIGPITARFIALAIAISILGALNATILTASRVYYAMAKDGVFFHKLAEVHPRFRTPAVSIVAGSLWSAVLAVSGTFEQLFTYTIFTGWIFYCLAALSIFVYRRKWPDRPRPYSVPAYPWTPLLFIVAAVALVINTIAAQPRTAIIGLFIVFLGAPAYGFWRSRRREVLPRSCP